MQEFTARSSGTPVEPVDTTRTTEIARSHNCPRLLFVEPADAARRNGAVLLIFPVTDESDAHGVSKHAAMISLSQNQHRMCCSEPSGRFMCVHETAMFKTSSIGGFQCSSTRISTHICACITTERKDQTWMRYAALRNACSHVNISLQSNRLSVRQIAG